MKRFILITFCVLMALMQLGYSVMAQKSSYNIDAKMRSLFIYNLSKYIIWPQEKLRGSFKIGICDSIGDIEFHLKKTTQNKKVANLNIEIAKLKSPEFITVESDLVSRSLNVLYVEGEIVNIYKVIQYCMANNILLITDHESLGSNIMINFVKLENRIKFEINKKTVELAGLGLPEAVRKMAFSVYHNSELIPESPSEESQKEWEKLYELTRVELNEKFDELKFAKRSGNFLQGEIDVLNSSLDVKQKELEKKSNELDLKVSRMKETDELLQAQERKMKLQKDTILHQMNGVKAQKIKLDILQQQYNEKKAQISNQDQALTEKSLQIDNQQLMIYGFGSMLVIMIILSAVVFKNYKEKHKTARLLEEQNIEIQEKSSHLREAYALIEEKNKEFTDSVMYGKHIQEAIMPSESYWSENFENFAMFFRPRDIVSGDFHWAYVLADGRKIWATADCTGHGVPGAFMSMIGTALLNEVVIELGVVTPADILGKVREGVIKALKQSGEFGEARDGMDMSICLLESDRKTLHFASANNPLYLVRKSNKMLVSYDEKKTFDKFPAVERNGFIAHEIKGDKQPVGYEYNMKPFEQHSIRLEPNDVIFTFSDGYADQFGGEKGKKLKYLPFKKMLLDFCSHPLPDHVKLLSEAFENWKGEYDQVDDVLVIGVKV